MGSTDPRRGRSAIAAAALALSMLQPSARSQHTLQTWCAPDTAPYFGTSLDVVGDIDSDGLRDVVIGSAVAPFPAFVLSGADGHALYAFPAFGQHVRGVGDVNADAVPDLALAAWGAGLSVVEVRSGADGSLLLHLIGNPHNPTGVGESVDGAGDVDGDGRADIIVGEPYANALGMTQAGRVRVYAGAHGALLHEFQGSRPYAHAGRHVAGLGDLDGDGRGDVAFDDLSLSAAGGRFPPLEVVRVVSAATGAAIHDFFADAPSSWSGPTVESAGDLDSDGVNDIVVGFHGQSALLPPITRAYSGSSGELLLEIVNPFWWVTDGFASGVGDANGDGTPDIGVRLDVSPSAGNFFSTVGIFSGTKDAALLYLLKGEAAFGACFAGLGDVDADGHADIAFGTSDLKCGAGMKKGFVRLVSMEPPFVSGISPEVASMADLAKSPIVLTGSSLEFMGQVQFGALVLEVGSPAATLVDDSTILLTPPPPDSLGTVKVSVSAKGTVTSNAVLFELTATDPPVLNAPAIATPGETATMGLFGSPGHTAVLLASASPDTLLVQGWPVLEDHVLLTVKTLDTLGTADASFVVPPTTFGLVYCFSQLVTLDRGLVGTSEIGTTLVFP